MAKEFLGEDGKEDSAPVGVSQACLELDAGFQHSKFFEVFCECCQGCGVYRIGCVVIDERYDLVLMWGVVRVVQW